MIRHGKKALGFSLFTALLVSFAPAYADIGGIGSSVQGDAPAQSAQDDSSSLGDVPAGSAIAPASNEQYINAIAAVRSGDAINSTASVAPTSNVSAASGGATNPEGAVMIIRYNQQYVYYDNPLRKVVYKVSATRPEAKYDLESVIPRDSKAFENDKYNQNLQNVVNVLGKYGVSGDRVSSRVIVSDSVKYQEINIFVR